ncbi:MAG: hypothetical protein K5655_04450 [Lachnospiraceae bacterium]|nr:hypothetical protein [Lachnospiraceae bacterium]
MLEYLWELGQAKDAGLLDMTWDEIAELINKAFKSEDEYLTSSAYRKRYSAAKEFKEEVFSKELDNEYLAELNEKKRELERAKIQLRDERNAYSAQNRDAARLEENLDMLCEKLQEIGKINFNKEYKIIKTFGDSSLIATIADLHMGQTFESSFGQYNSEIAINRLNQYSDEIVEIQERHGCKDLYLLLLGDEISGLLHNTIRITNRENVIDQVKAASEAIASLCVEMSKHFEHVYVAGVSGNHARLFQNKEESLKNENLDLLITWIVKQITNHIDNITVLDNEIDATIASINVCGKTYLGVHGDTDSMNDSGIGRLVMAVGEIPYAIIGGHRHSPAYKEYNGVRYIQSGSFASTGDDYTISKRLVGKASQTVLVCNSNGINAIYNVELN